MLHKAVYWQLIISNPVEHVQPQKVRKPKRRYYDKQCKILLQNLSSLVEDQIKYKGAIILTIFTGVRLSKLMGLEWQDIDLKTEIVNINRSSQYLANKGVFTKTPKVLSEKLQFRISLFLCLSNIISYGMMSPNRSMVNYGLILIGYLYKLMANLCPLLQ